MKYGIYTMDEFRLEGKTVLCRVDINQPVDKTTGRLKDTTRIRGCVPTIRELSDKGAKVVLMAHQGGDLEYKNYFSTKPHSEILSEFLGKPVRYIDDICGPYARECIRNLKNGEILLLENVRFLGEELTLFETKLNLSHEEQAKSWLTTRLAPLGDLYLCDAFAASHRDQPSLCGFEQMLPSCMGRLFEKEYEIILDVMSKPKPPCVFVLGGAKIEDAFLMMDTVLAGSADLVLTGGLAANVLLHAAGVDIGETSRALLFKKKLDALFDKAKQMVDKYAGKLLLPSDLACVKDGVRYDVSIDALKDDEAYVDIGKKTAADYAAILKNANTIFVNGPMGVFEEEASALGTKTVWQAAGGSEGYSVIGGGDSITAAAKFGVTEQMSYVCTGGGALVRILSGEEVPVVKALREGAKRFPADK